MRAMSNKSSLKRILLRTKHSSPQMKRSVRFNLDQNITSKHQASPPSACWYSNEEVRSFLMSTVRTASAYRQLVVALRSMPRRENQHTFLTEVLRLHERQDILHIHGIEYLVASDSMRMYINRMKQELMQAVREAQAQPGRHSNDVRIIAMISMKYSSVLKARARKIAIYHERHASNEY